ncbi:TetR/AcrR family transcriptional regulator [Azospirillum sp. SYSU D00513]|uniref:TetR/AcrR family transcriptional regulator n=1 Tax=Azospirillum sp. SYSU D00513 TaxID=2812561 RepID=UPI0032B50774
MHKTSAEVDPASGGRIRQRNAALILSAAEKVFAASGFNGASMAEIAAAAGLPKANLHYYFGTKEALYRAVLTNIIELWLGETHGITPEADPAEALGAYVRAKMRWSRERPDASRVIANELIHGAAFLTPYLEDDLRRLVDEKSAVIEQWIEAGRIAKLDPRHLFFSLWAMTQTYADFDLQIRAVLGGGPLSDAEYEHATEQVVAFVLRGCGLTPRG